jgi:hypothetical protein
LNAHLSVQREATSPAPAAAGDLSVVGQIGGAATAVAKSGNLIFAGEGPAVAIVDVTNPADPIDVGRSSLLPGVVGGIAVAAGYAYVATRPTEAAPGSLHIFDVSAPANPTEVGSLAAGGEDIEVDGSFAYLAARSDGLLIVDVSDPANPMLTGQLSGVHALEVEVTASLAYAATGGDILIVDVTNPASPTEIGSVTGALFAHLAVAGNRLYATNPADLFVFDISNPSSPVELGRTTDGGSAGVVTGTSSYAYVGSGGYGGLAVIDVTNPASPLMVGFIGTEGTDEDVLVDGTTVYFANGAPGLAIVDAASPAAPEIIATYATVPNADDVVVQGRHAYVTGGPSAGLRIVDVGDPTRPILLGAASLGGADVVDVAVAGSYAYVAANLAGLRILDVANPSAPAEVGAFTAAGNVTAVAVAGQLAYTAGPGQLTIVDVANPASPTQVGSLPFTGSAVQIAVAASRAYLISRDPGRLHIVDVTTPSAPIEIGGYDVPGGFPVISVPTGMAVGGSFVHLSVATEYNPSRELAAADPQLPYGRVETLDVSNPAAPLLVDVEEMASPPWDVAVARFFRWTPHAEILTPGFYGVRLSLTVNPGNPRPLGALFLPGVPVGVAARGRFAYVAAQTGGLFIVRRG